MAVPRGPRAILCLPVVVCLSASCTGVVSGDGDGASNPGGAAGESGGSNSGPNPGSNPGAGTGSKPGAGGAAGGSMSAGGGSGPTPPGASGPLMGPSAGRRLTREEYAYTVLDVLKYDLGIDRATLAEDQPADGFRNSLTGLTASAVRTSAYETVAGRVASSLKWAGGLALFAPCPDSTATCESGYIKGLGRALYRRRLTDAEVTNLAKLFAATRMDPPAFETGARLVLEAMLQSPHFLFRPEKTAPTPTGFDVATRLSYLLWKSAPSEDILTAAEQGKLATDVGIREVVARMLGDEKVRRGVRELADDWLQLYRITAREPDPKKGITPDLLREMRDETLAFVGRIAWDEPADLMTLLTDKKSDLGPNLARLYGLTPTGTTVKRYDLASNPGRLGLLTQPAVLALHADTDSASIVDRGLIVMRMFLCAEPPSPPPGVDTTAKGIAQNLTDREKFALHSANATCVACHAAIDPLGKPFEPYDLIGRRRMVDAYGNKLREDTSFTLDGKPYETATVADFANVLAKSQTIEDCLVQKVFQYAYGRLPSADDTRRVAEVSKDFRAQGRKYRGLIETLTVSPGFRAAAPAN